MEMTGQVLCARDGCTAQVVQAGGRGHRPRRFCSDACRQAAYRDRLTTRQAAAQTLRAWAAAEPAREREDVTP